MLKEINCNKFIKNPLVFQDGLNTILGDNFSTNSIGKSTMLMIIDFVFGGNSFIDNNSGAIKEFGHLIFKFKFEFNSKVYYYSRSTETSEIIGSCDQDYNVISELPTDSYTANLKSLYNVGFESSFRAAVNPYSRIWKKDNYNVDKPILNFSKESEAISVENLIKLFGLHSVISQTAYQIKAQEESKKILAGMVKKNFAPKLTKTEFLKNEKE